jgi:hypothetical protein
MNYRPKPGITWMGITCLCLAATGLLIACLGNSDTVAKPGEDGFDSATYCEANPSAHGCCLAEARHILDFEDIANRTLVPLSGRYKDRGIEISQGASGPFVVTADFVGNQEGNAAVSGENALLIGFNRTPMRFTFMDPIDRKKATVNRVSAMVGDRSDETDLIIMKAFNFGGVLVGADSFTAQPSGQAGDRDFGELVIDTAGIYYVTVNDTDASGANLDDFTFGCLHYELKR